MRIAALLKFDTIGKKYLFSSFLFILGLFVVLTGINVSINNSLIQGQMDKRGNAMSTYMAKTSVFYYTNYDLGALDGFVKDVIKDPDVVYAVFYDENKKALTISSKKPSDTSALMEYEQDIKDDSGRTIGSLSLGYTAKAVSAAARRGIMIMLATMMAALIVLGVGINVFVRRVITRPLAQAVAVANRLRDGDLTVRIEEAGLDEIGQLASALKNMVDKLNAIMSQVAASTLDVNSAAHSISAATDQQAVVASQQSATVAEITSTIEELSASSSQIAEHAQSVVSLATGSWENTKKGANVMETVIRKMNEIDADNQSNTREIVELGKKSKEISKVMEIINSIADQTKLIAFNAALEASSAGEAGKRFGVVAVEIRRLADNVMESTGEIRSKISEIQVAINQLVVASEKSSKGIQEGMAYSNETAQTLMEVVEAVQSTQEAAKQISLSTQQQKSANSQVVIALREIVSGAAQTSTAISQLSSTSDTMKELSDTLKGQVENFKLN